jgi:hypothetical protein
LGDFFFQGNDGRMQAQLQNAVDFPSSILLDFRNTVNVPWIKHQRLFANGISAGPQGKVHVGVVQVIRRTNRYEVYSVHRRPGPESGSRDPRNETGAYLLPNAPLEG